MAAHVAYLGTPSWQDRGWGAAWEIDAEDGRAAAFAVSGLLERSSYAAILSGDSPMCREVLGRLAGRLRLPLTARVLSARFDDDCLEVVRAEEEGRRSAKYRLATLPAVVVCDSDASCAPSVARGKAVDIDTIVVRCPNAVRPVSERALGPSEIALDEADVVVAGGRGIGQEGFRLVEALAGILHGAVGASRVAVDLGWAPRSAQVGMTGQTVHPRLYIACGISGAIHHAFGMRDSDFVVAINNDPAAPIFKFADAAIVGDAAAVLAALVEALAARSRPDAVLPRDVARAVA